MSDGTDVDAQVFFLRTEILEKDTAMDALVAEVDRLRRLIGTMEAAIVANEKQAPVVSKRKQLALERWAYYHERKDVVAASLGEGKHHWREIKRITDKEWCREQAPPACPSDVTVEKTGGKAEKTEGEAEKTEGKAEKAECEGGAHDDRHD